MSEVPANSIASALQNAAKLNDQVLTPIKQQFIGKDEVIDLLGVCLVARENLFILGPPGTAKSAIVQHLARRMQGTIFDYLLTQFTEPNEIFGPFDIRQLRDGNLVTNTEGMLPEATFVFLDELLNANSAILNSLLMVLNERVFRRGRETKKLPTLLVVGASNQLPQDEALGALFDRFLLRVQCDLVEDGRLQQVLRAGWALDRQSEQSRSELSIEDIVSIQNSIHGANLEPILDEYSDLVVRLRQVGVALSDRRAVKLQRLIAASAFLCGRETADRTDLWVLRYVWDTTEQQSVVETIVQTFIDEEKTETEIVKHPRSLGETPDPERLANDVQAIITQATGNVAETERALLRDQLNVLAGRCAWVTDDQQRTFLESRVEEAWNCLSLPS